MSFFGRAISKNVLQQIIKRYDILRSIDNFEPFVYSSNKLGSGYVLDYSNPLFGNKFGIGDLLDSKKFFVGNFNMELYFAAGNSNPYFIDTILRNGGGYVNGHRIYFERYTDLANVQHIHEKFIICNEFQESIGVPTDWSYAFDGYIVSLI